MGDEIQNKELPRGGGDVWEEYWSGQEDLSSWDYGSYLILNIMKSEVGDFTGKKMLECGSGTGRISMRLVREGAQGILLDKTESAMVLARKTFSGNSLIGHFARGNLLSLPFRDESVDVVWNAGVIEHFSESEQIRCLSEMARVCKKDGFVLLICPYKSVFHRVGKAFLEMIRRWPFGYEEPIASLARLGKSAHLNLVKDEYTRGIFIFVVEIFRFILPGKMGLKLTSLLRNVVIRGHEGPFKILFNSGDSFLSRLMGGYMLVSLFKRHS